MVSSNALHFSDFYRAFAYTCHVYRVQCMYDCCESEHSLLHSMLQQCSVDDEDDDEIRRERDEKSEFETKSARSCHVSEPHTKTQYAALDTRFRFKFVFYF